MAAQSVFVLLKTDPKSSSTELARVIARFPGMQEVWLTEGKYSFVARFSVPPESLQRLKSAIARNKAVLGVECLPAPVGVEKMKRIRARRSAGALPAAFKYEKSTTSAPMKT